MELQTHFINIKTSGRTDIRDITDEVKNILSHSGLSEGNILIFTGGSTAGVTTIEYEPGLLKDYPEFFEKIIPSGKTYHHDETWHDGNGHSHIRAALQGASLTIPFHEKQLLLGTWQQIIFIDFDNRPRSRTITIQLTGMNK